jgi:hypothetical protein
MDSFKGTAYKMLGVIEEGCPGVQARKQLRWEHLWDWGEQATLSKTRDGLVIFIGWGWELFLTAFAITSGLVHSPYFFFSDLHWGWLFLCRTLFVVCRPWSTWGLALALQKFCFLSSTLFFAFLLLDWFVWP